MAVSGYTKEMLKAMQSVDIRTVDRNSLMDITEVEVDQKLSKQEKVLRFIEQIKNPYCYRHGKFVVKVSFADTKMSLEELLTEYIRYKC